MPVAEIEVPEIGRTVEISFETDEELKLAAGKLRSIISVGKATGRYSDLTPDPLVKVPIGPSSKSELSVYEDELNRRFQEVNQSDQAKPAEDSMAKTISSAAVTGVKRAQQILPTIIGSQASQVKSRAPSAKDRERAFREEVEAGGVWPTPIEEGGEGEAFRRADEFESRVQERARNLMEKRNAILDIWTGVAADFQKEINQQDRSLAQQEMAGATTQGDKWRVFKKYPAQTIASIVLESLPPAIAGATIGTATLGPGAGTAVGAGLASGSMEYASTLLGEAQSAGYDTSDPNRLAAFFNSRDYDKASSKALTRAGIIGTIDTATAGAAGALVKPALKQGMKSVILGGLKETGGQSLAGFGSEFFAQAATKEPGEEFDWFDMTMEAVSEGPTAIVEAGLNVAGTSPESAAPATTQANAESESVLKTEKEVIPSAVNKPKTTQLHGDVRQPEVAPKVAGQVPADVGGEGISARGQVQETPGGVPERLEPKPEETQKGGELVEKETRQEKGLQVTQEPAVAAETAAAEPFSSLIDRAESTPASEMVSFRGGPAETGGATGYMWELGSKAKTTEDVAALRSMAERSAEKVKALVGEGKLDEAMQEAGKQPAEAYEYATGVKLDGTPKWSTMEKRVQGYRPPVPDQQWIDANKKAETVTETTSQAPSEKTETKTEDRDAIESALDRLIELTDIDPTKLMEGITGLPVWLAKSAANAALRVIRLAYRGGRSLSESIAEGIAWLGQQNLQGYNESEARSYFESALAERGIQTAQTLEEQVQEESDIEQGETKRKQFAGYLKAGQARPVESIKQVRSVVRSQYFDPSGDITSEKTERAWQLANALANPVAGEELNRQLRQTTGRNIAPALLASDLQHYAFKLVGAGDLTLLHFLRENWSTLQAGSGFSIESAGRTLAGIRTDPNDAPIIASLAILFGWRKALAMKSMGVEDSDLWSDIKAILDRVGLTPEEFIDVMQGDGSMDQLQSIIAPTGQPEPGSGKPSGPVDTAQEEQAAPETDEKWQDETAKSILDKMESSQTEWIKPDKPINPIREYVKQALKDTTWPSVDAPDHTTRNVEAYVSKVSGELEVLGVSREFADRLAWEIHKERLNRWSLKNLKKLQRNAPDNITQKFLSRLVSLSPKAPKDKVSSILNEASRRPLSFEDTMKPDEWKGSLSDRLVAEGVSEQMASRVADELYTSKIPQFAQRQSAAFLRASEDVRKIVRAIVSAIKSEPYRNQNPEWRRRTARQYFIDAGLSPQRVDDAVRVFDGVFVARESEARSKAAADYISRHEPKERKPKESMQAMVDDLMEAVRIGLTDPNRTWEDSIASKNEWKGFSESEHRQLAEWSESIGDALPHEKAKLFTKINNLLASKAGQDAAHLIANYYANNQLSGTATQLLSYLNPLFSTAIRLSNDFISSIASGDFTRPMASSRALGRALESWSKEFGFAWKNDAYTSSSLRNIERVHTLQGAMERGLEAWKNDELPATERALGLLKYLASHVDIVRKSLQGADQAWQSVIREWQTLLGGRDLLKKAGWSDSQVENLFADAYMAAEGYYNQAVAAGMDELDAMMHAKDRLYEDLESVYRNKLGDTNAESILTSARLESELDVGNHRGEGGFLNGLLAGLQQTVQPRFPILYRMIIGFPRVNYNILSRAAWYSPWGFKRLMIDSRQRKAGVQLKDRQYAQSMATEIQRRQRLAETITGTIAATAILALYASQLGKDDDDKLVWIDMEGPMNAKERQQWLKSGHRPNSVAIKVPGHDSRVIVNWSRGGIESIQVPLAMAGAYEDARLNRKDPNVAEAAMRLLNLVGFLTPFGRRDYPTEKGITYSIAGKLSGFIPFAGLLRTINKIADTRDTSTLDGIFWAAIPAAPAFGGKPALNFLGEPVTSDMTGLKLQRLGLPITVSSPLSLYQLIGQKGIAPPLPRRDTIEKELRSPITDEDYYNFVLWHGEHVRNQMNQQFNVLKALPSKQFEDRLRDWSESGKNLALTKLRIQSLNQPQK